MGGALNKAAELLGAAECLYPVKRRRTTLPLDRAIQEKVTREVSASLGPANFTQAWSLGQDISLERAISQVDQLRLLVEQNLSSIPKKDAPFATIDLTKREVEVLRLVAVGLSNSEIASQLFLSPHTVRAHLFSIFNKAGVTSRTAAAHYASQNRLI
jgi:DNA-binding NarL/FixJ family response regulator